AGGTLDAIDLKVTDAAGAFDTDSAIPAVNTVDDPTLVVDDTVVTDEDVATDIDVLVNDTDGDAKSPVVSVTQGENGTVEINADGTLKYTPNFNWSGADSFMYTNAEGNTAKVEVTVNPVADPLAAESFGVTLGTQVTTFTTGFLQDLIDGNFTKNATGTTYTFDSGLIVTGSSALNWNNGQGIGVGNVRMDYTEAMTFTLPGVTSNMQMTVKNAVGDEINVSFTDLDGHAVSMTFKKITTSETEATITIDGQSTFISNSDWTLSNGSYVATVGDNTIHYLIDAGNDTDKVVFENKNYFDTFVITDADQGSTNGDNGFSIMDIQTDVLAGSTHTYPVLISGTLFDTDHSENIVKVMLSDMPGDAVLKIDGVIVNGVNGVFEIPNFSAKLDNDASDNFDDIYLTTTQSGFIPTIIGVTQDGTDEAYTIVGGNADSVLAGSEGNDYISGGSGSDTIIGGKGNDTLVFDASDALIDGGEGFDTLILTTDIDMSALANNPVRNVEALDIANHQITLSLEDVLTMTDINHDLYILKDSTGSVVLADSSQWAKAAETVTETVNGSEHVWDVYHSTADATVTLKIDADTQHTL
ncbi:MAG: cadherin-like domain-containing protein, partial [Campylobacterales bacterium]|nr:cadherin-like domain-containing protein [Campylobacterales bacterium]